ncbi:MAG: prepilin-type N-terminal cleavage/methylation domain-containing protein [Rickettsiales bacterium]|jgi:prepilin-type N-terminal cleavage/methylation domain-containing protein
MQLEKETKLGFSLIELSVSILIIGLLIVGVSKTSQIIGDGKLLAARSITKNSFPYLNSSKLALWYDAAAEESFDADIEDGDSVATWIDVNPDVDSNNIDVTASGTSPIYVAGATNGLPAIRFTNDQLLIGNLKAGKLTEDGEQITIFIVQNYFFPNHTSTNFKWRTEVGNINIRTYGTASTGEIIFDFGACCGADARLRFRPPQPFADKTNILTYLNTPNDFSAVRINGFQHKFDDMITSSVDINLTADLIIAETMNGDMNEIIVFKTALKDSQIESVERYLSRKWGVDLE